jgi:hypothetical protein
MIYMMSEVRSVTFDEMVDALADIQRRKLMVALLDHNPQDDSPAAVGGSEIDTLDHLVSMNHVHLPKLANYGFIEWDEANHEVSKGPNFDEIRPLLELLATHEDELPADWL